MEYGQLCWPFSFVGIVPGGDHPHLNRDDRVVVVLAGGTANIGRVARWPLFFTLSCDLVILRRDGPGRSDHRLSNPLVREHNNVDAGSRSGCDRQARRDLRGAEKTRTGGLCDRLAGEHARL